MNKLHIYKDDQRNIWVIIKFFIVFCSLSFLFVGQQFMTVLVIFTLIVSILFFVRVKDNPFLFIIGFFILYSNYSIVASYYFSTTIISTAYTISKELLFESIKIMQLFISVLLAFTPDNISHINVYETLHCSKKSNPLIAYLCFSMALIIVFGNFILFSTSGRNDVNSLGEYSLVFVVIGLYYAVNSKKALIFAHIAVLAICTIVFINGGRILGLQLALALFICVYINRISKVKIVILFILGIVLLTVVGQLRENFVLNYSSISKAFSTLLDSWFVLDTSYAAYHASNIFLKVASMQTAGERLMMGGKFVLSMFLGGGLVKNSNLSSFTQKFYWHGGGGLTPFYFYYYLGYIGVIFIASIIGIYLRKINKLGTKFENIYRKRINKLSSKSKGIYLRRINKSSSKFKDFHMIIAIYLACSVPRWYLYSPSNLFRGVLIICIVAFAMRLLNREVVIKKRIKHQRSILKREGELNDNSINVCL